MSYLEAQLNNSENRIVAPAKEGGLAALATIKLWAGAGIPIHTVPLYHHSFKLWKRAVLSNSDYVFGQIVTRCNEQCKIDANLLHGANTLANSDSMSKCFKECDDEWSSVYNSSLVKNEKDSNRVFDECLSQVVRNEIQYENVLTCKQKAFTYYLDRSFDSERDLLNKGLNKYA